MNQLFAQWDSIQEAINDVRSDQTPTNWMVCGYVNGGIKELELKGKGEGGVNEMREQFKANNGYYGLARIEEMIDSSLTIKFAFVKFVGNEMKPMLRAGITPQVGEITTRFKPYHVDMYITEVDEISQDIVEDLVGKASMSRTKVMEKHEGEKIQRDNEERQARRNVSSSGLSPTATSSSATTTTTTSTATTTTSSPKPVRSQSTIPRSPATQSSSPSAGGELEFENLEEIQQAIRDVRSDQTDTNWMAVTYVPNSKTKMHLLGSGNGGVEEMKSQWSSNGVYFGLVRVTEIIDESETVKFVLVHMLGDSTPMMLKARVSTHKGQVEALLQPYHVTLFATNVDEITQDEISTLVAKASQSYKWEIKK